MHSASLPPDSPARPDARAGQRGARCRDAAGGAPRNPHRRDRRGGTRRAQSRPQCVGARAAAPGPSRPCRPRRGPGPYPGPCLSQEARDARHGEPQGGPSHTRAGALGVEVSENQLPHLSECPGRRAEQHQGASVVHLERRSEVADRVQDAQRGGQRQGVGRDHRVDQLVRDVPRGGGRPPDLRGVAGGGIHLLPNDPPRRRSPGHGQRDRGHPGEGGERHEQAQQRTRPARRWQAGRDDLARRFPGAVRRREEPASITGA